METIALNEQGIDLQFAALRSLPAFGQALKSLQDLAAQTPERPRLQLPPPPIIDATEVSRGRY